MATTLQDAGKSMKRTLALSIVVLSSILAQPAVRAAEGRVSELQAPPLDASRVAKYQGARGAAAVSAVPQSGQMSGKTLAKTHALRPAAKTAALKSVRPSATALSTRSSDFW